MDDQEKAAADAMILLNIQVEERVVEALANVLVHDGPLRGRIMSATPGGAIRGAISAMIVDVMRSPEFASTLWQELKNDASRRAYNSGYNDAMSAALAKQQPVASSNLQQYAPYLLQNAKS